ncbi:hypothetical protein GGR52DRAFT_571520 [Hypoxylon sp. FL1284]|nr:hypothetical protein GGR52DRAFT_571520 [Hypoxylon sp. FL1284]
MTKQWDTYEETIKALYAENTLSVVRQIMIDKHGFRASTRAYRGRLIRWGVRKYNCRKLSGRASSRASSPNDGALSSASDPASPVLPSYPEGNLAQPPGNRDAAHHQLQAEMRERAGDGGHLAMPGQGDQQVVGGDRPIRAYVGDPYGNKIKAVLSLPQLDSGVQYEWSAISSPLTNLNNSSTANDASRFDNHADTTIPPPYFGGYAQMAPPASVSNTYGSAIESSYDDISRHNIDSHAHNLGYYRTAQQQQGHKYDGAAG